MKATNTSDKGCKLKRERERKKEREERERERERESSNRRLLSFEYRIEMRV